MSKKDLLRCEIPIDARHLAVHHLLNPKPKFELTSSSLVSKINQFLPQIQKANQELNNLEHLKQVQIQDDNALTRIKIKELIPDKKMRKYMKRTGREKLINMDLYLGLLDTNGEIKE